MITSDLLGFPAEVSENIAREVKNKYGIPRDRLLLNSSHTHGAPALTSPIHFIYGPRANPEQWQQVEEYTRELERKVVQITGEALQTLRPAKLGFGQTKTDFGINRRIMTPNGIRSFVPNPEGPMDQSLPVLRVDSKQGELLAVVFGYAAHPTTITGPEHYYEFSGDYAGFAQQFLEERHPGALALFVQGCGGDIMVSPRGTAKLAREYGGRLSNAVSHELGNLLRPVHGPLKTAFETFPVTLAPAPSRESLETQLKQGDIYHRWHAQEMLKSLDRNGSLPATYPYPLQAWQFGEDLTLIAMAGEVVVDYALRLKKEVGGNPVWVAGYSSDVFAYIPSRRVLEEGGYEGADAMIYYMQPGPFAPSVEETIIGKTHELVERVRSPGEKTIP